ncbi:MAG TPA: hypothetical protein VLG49_01165 [Rhabdochlamydiaceae bacterium]|nr:hypothetical protein [Rhabdochlamydiaceae bacterium]
MALGSVLFVCLSSKWKQQDPLKNLGKNESVECLTSQSRPYDAIGSGPLSLNASQFSPFTPNLSREIIVVAKNTRPDVRNEEACLLMGLKNCKQEKVVLHGEQIFLEYAESGAVGDTLKFSNEKTHLWIRPLALDKNTVLIEVAKEVHPNELDACYEEKTQFVLQVLNQTPSKIEKARKENQEPYAQILKNAKCWGTDTLVQQYGGEEYKELMHKYKVEFSNEHAAHICFLAQGDFLTWENNQWKVCLLDEIAHHEPAAYIKNLNSKGIEIEMWDETGFYPLNVKLETVSVPKLMCRQDNLPTSIRLRTASQINCMLGKRRLVLRKGDWLLKTGSGWRILKKLQEIEDCLQHKLKGELLIFDGIEKEIGQILLKGTLFDEMRTQIQPISIPIITDKKSSRHNKIQRRPFHKRRVPPSSNNPGRIGGHQLAYGGSCKTPGPHKIALLAPILSALPRLPYRVCLHKRGSSQQAGSENWHQNHRFSEVPEFCNCLCKLDLVTQLSDSRAMEEKCL